MLPLWLGACGSGDGLPQRLADCADATCQSRWVTARWPEDPDGVRDGIAAVADPLLRGVLVRQVTNVFPGDAGALCDLIADDAEKMSCRNRNNRPHIQEREASPDAGGGLRLARPIPSPWVDVAPAPVPCEGEPRVCQTLAAQERAGKEDPEGAAAACAAIADERWSAECFFQAAEAAAKLRGDAGGDAAKLCLGSGSFVGRCLFHVVLEIAAGAPDAASGDTSAWFPVTRAIVRARRVLAADKDLVADFEHQTWAFALRFAYERADVVTGAPLGAVLPDARPHVVAAAAWRLVALERTIPRDLAGWVARLDTVLADRAPRAPGPAKAFRPAAAFPNHWAGNRAGEEKISRIAHLGGSFRARSEDPEDEATICVLEGAAVVDPPLIAPMEEALGHPSTLVRWTAARLLLAVDPQNGRLAMHEDEAHVVMGRTRGAKRGP